MQESEDSRVGADAWHQCENHCGCESGIFARLAQRELQILHGHCSSSKNNPLRGSEAVSFVEDCREDSLLHVPA